MEPLDIAELLRALESALTDAGLGVLVAQERTLAREGQTEDAAQIGDLDPVLAMSWQRSTLKPRRGEVRLTPLRERQRLAILLDLVEIAVEGTYTIERTVRDDLKRAADGVTPAWTGSLRFIEDPDHIDSELDVGVENEREWRLATEDELSERSAAVAEVMRLLDEIRYRLGVSRAEWLVTVEDLDSGRFQDGSTGGETA